MKYNIKIAITPAKVGYSISFIFLLTLIGGISSTVEIGSVLDMNIAMLSIIFCADTYYQELQSARWEVFYLLPSRSKCYTLCQRFTIQIAFMIICSSLGYWLFYLKNPMKVGDMELLLFVTSVLAITASAIFFGSLTVTIVNVFQNLWAGIGCALVLWFTLNPAYHPKLSLPKYVDLFRVSCNAEGFPQYLTIAKLTAVILSAVLMIVNYRLIIHGKERIR